MACDLRIAGATARLSDWHLKATGLGIGQWGAAVRLSRLVGVDKAKNLTMQYGEADLNFMYRLRRVMDPDGIMNPGKLLPSHPACGEGFRPPRPVLAAGAWI